MLALRKLLFPFSLLYGLIITLRNFLYDKGFLTSISFPVPVICVGNLSFGGTGKTPMIEYLIRLLEHDYRVAVLSRGYKRTSKGFYMADKNTTVAHLGDEPFQYYKNFPKIRVAVDANRNNGIAHLMKLSTPPEVILLDDAFQHRKTKPGLHILLTAYNDLYSDDFIVPAGNLRDTKREAKRADIIVVTKCPKTLAKEERVKIRNKINPKPYQQLFFSAICYDEVLKSLNDELPMDKLTSGEFTLVTGIANPKPLVAFLKEKQLRFKHLKYPDHYQFSKKEITLLKQEKLVITTEKDYVRLSDNPLHFYYLPIKTCFLENAEAFNTLIKHFVKIQ